MDIIELRKMFATKKSDFDEKKKDSSTSLEELRQMKDELVELKGKIELEEETRQLDLPKFKEKTRKVSHEVEVRDLNEEELEKEYEGVFLRAFRSKQLSHRDHEVFERMKEMRDAPTATPYLSSSASENGGLIIPKALSTKIETYKRQYEFDLTQLVGYVRTNVLSGSYVYEKLGTIEPWLSTSEWSKINEVATPQFEGKEYKIEDYAGILPIPRNLLEDTDQNLLEYIARYIARKTVITRNKKILDVIKANYTSKTTIDSFDSIKDVLDISLDPAISNGAKIITNQLGYNFLRKIKDAQGNYMMQPIVTDPDKKAIDGHEVVVLAENTLPSDGKKAPVYIGQFEEAIKFFDRGVYEITPTTVGGSAFLRNSYDIRVIDRFTCILTDKEAVVACEVDTSKAPKVPKSEG